MSENPELEVLLEGLSDSLRKYPDSDKKRIIESAENLDQILRPLKGDLKRFRRYELNKKLLEDLGYDFENAKSTLKIKANEFTTSFEKITRSIMYLKDIGVDSEKMKIVLQNHPKIVTYDAENNLKPTFEYLRDNFNTKIEDVISYPGLLSFSLENRIKPRFEFMKLKKVKEEKHSASQILYPKDEGFCEIIGCDLKDYEEFLKNYFQKS